MKKLLLFAALMFAPFGVFADELDDFVAGARKSAEADGDAVRFDRAHRIVFMDYKLVPGGSFTEADLARTRESILNHIRSAPQEAEFIRRHGVTIIFNYISDDRAIFTIIIAPSDL